MRVARSGRSLRAVTGVTVWWGAESRLKSAFYRAGSVSLVITDNLIEIKDVNFAYGRRPILTGINMTIPRGKVVALMGISGSGKTKIGRAHV